MSLILFDTNSLGLNAKRVCVWGDGGEDTQALQLNVTFSKETEIKEGRSQDSVRKQSCYRYFQRENTMNLTGIILHFVIFFFPSNFRF